MFVRESIAAIENHDRLVGVLGDVGEMGNRFEFGCGMISCSSISVGTSVSLKDAL